MKITLGIEPYRPLRGTPDYVVLEIRGGIRRQITDTSDPNKPDRKWVRVGSIITEEEADQLTVGNEVIVIKEGTLTAIPQSGAPVELHPQVADMALDGLTEYADPELSRARWKEEVNKNYCSCGYWWWVGQALYAKSLGHAVSYWDTEVQVLVNGDAWSEHPKFPRQDWRAEVAAGDSQRGYWDWVNGQLEAERHNKRLEKEQHAKA